MTEQTEVLVIAVDKAVRDKKRVKAEARGNHVLVYVVSDYNALLRVDAADRANLLEVIEIWLAGGGVVVGRDIREIVDVKPRPLNAAVGRGFRENRVCRDDQSASVMLDVIHNYF